jgi:hypothetical protein
MLNFFKRKRKKIEVNCPVCLREFSFKYYPDEVKNFDYPYSEGAGFVFSLECNFCDAEAAIVQYRSGVVDTFDNKWVKLEKEHREGIDAVKGEVLSVKERLEKNPDNALKSQLAQREAKLAELEHTFSLQKEKYSDFQTKWQGKWQEVVDNHPA